MGSIPGAVVGGYLLGLIEVLAFVRFGSNVEAGVAFAALFLVLVIRPQGLFGARLRERLRGRVDFFIQLFTDPVGFYNQHELLIAQIGINAILAISLFVTFYSGQLTLANAGFMAIGAYTTVIMSLYLPTPLPLNMLVGALLATLVG